MRNETRVLFNQYLNQISALNNVGSAAEKFTVAPTVQQKIENKIQESSEFLKRINIIGVDELAGNKVGLGIGSPIAKNVDTNLQERSTSDPSVLDEVGYMCTQTNFDTHITYEKIDSWAKFPDFQIFMRNQLINRQALDRIMVGFNGVKRSATSNLVENPLLQDVNVGWFEKYRQYSAQRVMKNIVVNENAEYKNLDAVVMDAVSSLIDPWYQSDTGLVAVVGRNLMHDKYFPVINTNHNPENKLASDIVVSQKRLGNIMAYTVPFVPDNSILITRLDNLSLYYQTGGRRRAIIDNPKRNRIENLESSNDGYVVEDYGCGCLIEGIQLGAPKGA